MSKQQATLDGTWRAGEPADPDPSPDEERVCTADGARYGTRDEETEGHTLAHGDEPAATPEKPRDRCQNCGAQVTSRERRLFGDNANYLWHCYRCVPSEGALGFGAGAKPTYEAERTLASQTQGER